MKTFKKNTFRSAQNGIVILPIVRASVLRLDSTIINLNIYRTHSVVLESMIGVYFAIMEFTINLKFGIVEKKNVFVLERDMASS